MSRRDRGDGTGFRPLGLVAEPVGTVDRVAARSAYRLFRGAGGFEAAIPEQVVARMLALGRAAAPLEWLGLVVGRVGDDARGRHVVVLGVVPDAGALAERHFVQSTVASESETREAARKMYPDGVVVGWVHGHVRHGAQYSPTDHENQATWRQEHSLGIVVDPWDPRELAVYRGPRSELLMPACDHDVGALVARRPAEDARPGPTAAPHAPLANGKPPGDARRKALRRIVGGITLAALALVSVAWRARPDRPDRDLAARVGKVERRLARLEVEHACRDRAWAPWPAAPDRSPGQPAPASFDAGAADARPADVVGVVEDRTRVERDLPPGPR